MIEAEQKQVGGEPRDSDLAFLRAVIEHGSISRAEAATVTGVSKPTASAAASRLESAGVVRDVGKGQGGRGRSPQIYEVSPEFGTAVVGAARAGSLTLGEVDLRGDLVRQQRFPLDLRITEDDFARVLASSAREFCSAAAPPLCAAISVAAPVDPRTSRPVRLEEAPFRAADVDVVGILAPFVSGHVVVDNDVNWSAAAACELHPEIARGLSLHLHLGTGLGAALTVDGRLVRGRRGAFGEIGRLRGAGRTVSARLEQLAVLGGSGHSLDVERTAEVLKADDAQSEDLRQVLAEAIGNAILMIDPEHTVLSGPLAEDSEALAILRRRVVRTIDEESLPASMVLPSDPDPALLGAVVHAQRMLHELAAQAVAAVG